MAASPDARYYEAAPPDIGIVWALLFDVLSIASILFLCFRLRERKSRTLRLVGTAVIVFSLLFAVYQVQRSTTEYLVAWMTYSRLYHFKIILSSSVLLLLALRTHKTFRSAEALLLVMSPLLLVAATNALWEYRTAHVRDINKGSAAGMLSANLHRNRVIWIIFDELDQRMMFDSRPARVCLDQFDAVRAEALYATAASSPNANTMPSLPSLILGGRVGNFVLYTSDLRFQLQGSSEWHNFASHANIFSRARAEGFDTALSGWHHPYCRLIGPDLSACAWERSGQPFLIAEENLGSSSFLGKAVYLLAWQARRVPYRHGLAEPGGTAEVRRVHKATFEFVESNGEKMLRNRDLNLVLIHLPIPHPPGIWDVRRGAFTTGKTDYVDNLQLANDTLGRLRHVLEETGDWDSSSVLISSDHPYRPEVWENDIWGSAEMRELSEMRRHSFVPFLLKLPRQHQEVIYTNKFNTVLSSELLLALLRGEVSSSEAAVRWLNLRADSSP